MRAYRVRRHDKPQDDNHYWISFTDLMSALLVIFILAVAALVLQLGNQQQRLEGQQESFTEQVNSLREAETVRAEMLHEIQDDLKDQGIEVYISENNSVISIPSELLGFDKGSYDIKDEYRDVSLKIGSAVSKAVQQDDRSKYLDTVFVEGHTDNADFSGLEGTGNWGLSTFRAISLWTLWEEELSQEQKLSELASADGNRLFSVSGYGETRPMTEDQATDTDRALNRRIDLRFTTVRPDSSELERIERLGEVE